MPPIPSCQCRLPACHPTKDCTKKSLTLTLASVTLTPIGPKRGELTSRPAPTRGSPTDDVTENARFPPRIVAGVTQSVVGRLSQVCVEMFATSKPPVGSDLPPPIFAS